ncbi:MAG TPA: hypothetical protein VHO25_15610 [Polyangiaceae bacterium]|nr:hypothetical protein [Polyangiaceae bacterium]
MTADTFTERPSLSVHGHELHRITEAEALTLVDETLGSPEDWAASALLQYRLSADFQADWKAEVGHWLHAAKAYGFLDQMIRPIMGERKRNYINQVRNLHDRRHLKLHQHLASAMFCHYFAGLGWSFAGWETETGGSIDIDLALKSPSEALIELQIKAPDQPGIRENGKYVGGNSDSRVIKTLEHGVEQLPRPARSVAMVGLFAQRDFELSATPLCLISHLYGSTVQVEAGDVLLAQEYFGHFMTGQWNHVAGVVALDISRRSDLRWDKEKVAFIDSLTYPCTVLLNPKADRPADPEWFPRARVLALEGDTFRWIHGEPRNHTIPTGTRVVGSHLPFLAAGLG